MGSWASVGVTGILILVCSNWGFYCATRRGETGPPHCFGTQDNNLYYHSAFADQPKLVVLNCCEGYFIETQLKEGQVEAQLDAQLTFTAVDGGGCANSHCLVQESSNLDAPFSNVTPWPDPPGPLAGAPKIIGSKSFHVQGVATASGFSRGWPSPPISARRGTNM
jgi:hypothetical protein